ncbi:MAG: hypothetical protein PHF63_11015 [Herbinix sp.]|nr:hypothetical protein [Herbinix sp.]
MNRDNRNQDDRNDQRRDREQRYSPDGFMTPPFAPGMQNMQGMPTTPPPNFIPEGPGMERRSMGGPTGYGEQFRPGMQTRPRELRRCLNRFTFIWLVNGNSFWFFPTFIDRQFVVGFRWRRNRWEYDRININRIIFFRCF